MSSVMKGHLRYQAGSWSSQVAMSGLGEPAGAVLAPERELQKHKIGKFQKSSRCDFISRKRESELNVAMRRKSSGLCIPFA
jgi:hypothetical protein